MAGGTTARKKRTLFSIAEEVDGYNTIPDPAPTLVDTFETNDTLKPALEYARSNHRRADRNRPGSVLVGRGVTGTLGIQFPFGHHDNMLQRLFYAADWTSSEEHISGETTISFESIATSSSSYAKILDSGNGLASYDVGETIEVESASGVNDGVYKIHSVAAGEIELEYADLTDEAEGGGGAGAVTLHQFAALKNGTTCTSFLAERVNTDQASGNKFAQMLGLIANEAELTIAPRSLITGSFGIIGAAYSKSSTTLGDGANTPLPTDISMNAVQHISKILVGGNALNIRQITLRVANGAEALSKPGQLDAFDVVEDDITFSGEIQVYSGTGSASADTEFVKALAGTTSNIYTALKDTAGNQMVLDLPTIRYQDADESPGDSSAGAIITRLPFEGEITVAELLTARFARRAAA